MTRDGGGSAVSVGVRDAAASGRNAWGPARSTASSLVLAVTASGLVWGWTQAVDEAARTAGIVTLLAVIGVGAALRLLRAPAAAVVVAQVIALAGVGMVLSRRPGLEAAPSAIFTQLIDYAQTLARSTSFPLPFHPAAELAVGLVCGLAALLADAAVQHRRSPVGALVPLIALAVAPAHVPGAPGLGVPVLAVVVVGFGVLCLLRMPGLASARDQAVSVVVATALVTGSIGAAAALSPRWAPTAAPRRGPIQMTDISVSLKREIQRGANTPALTYRTDDGRPAYLRLYALPRFDADGWHLSDADVRTGKPPEIPVRDGVRRTTHVQITGFASEWLPAPYSTVATTAPDTFGYLPETTSLLALSGDRTHATAELSYDVTSVAAQPDRAALLMANGAIPSGAASTGMPEGVPASIRQLASRLTAGARSDGAKAVALTDYLARPEFTYSLDAAPGSGYDVLETFLLKEHRGFCVQYATSLAVMARSVGIPSRVAVGFAPGKAADDGWRVTMHDLHAWTELYLADYGWVAFDPTPGIGRAATSANPEGEVGDAPATPTPKASETPEPKPTASRTTSPPLQPEPPATAAGGADVGGVLRGLALLLGLLVLALAPRGWRLHQRRLRLRPDAMRSGSAAALAAWQEVRALVIDHGRPWPAGSPRYAAATLQRELDDREAQERDAPGIATAVEPSWGSLALASEASLYGSPADAPAWRDWTPEVTDVEKELARSSSRVQRWRARWCPASLWTPTAH